FPAIHVLLCLSKTWMPGTRPGMTADRFGAIQPENSLVFSVQPPTADEDPVTDPSPWWDRDAYADRRPFLLARGRIMAALRDWFRARGFVEVETPILQVSPGNETHLHAFATEIAAPDGARATRYLHTSPE